MKKYLWFMLTFVMGGILTFLACTASIDRLFGCNEQMMQQSQMSAEEQTIMSHISTMLSGDFTTCQHSFGEWIQTVAADCQTEGRATRICTLCGCEESLIIPISTTHTPVIDAEIIPTCTANGMTEGSHCTVCQAILLPQQVIAALGHTPVVDVAILPTCTTEGKSSGSHCAVCETVFVPQQIIAPLGHTLVANIMIAPTCTSEGKANGSSCVVCHSVFDEPRTIARLDHMPVIDAAIVPTCTAAGKTEGKHCAVCHEVLVKQEIIPCKGHNYVHVAAVPPTSIEMGSTDGVKCADCHILISGCDIIPREGVLMYYEDFNSYENSMDTETVLNTIKWTKLTKDTNGVYSDTDAEFSIVNGRLYYDNYDAETLGEGDSRVHGKDGYYRIDQLCDDYMLPIINGKYTLQYDLEYTDAKNISRYAAIITECSPNGKAYNSFYLRIGGYANHQIHFYNSWKTYDVFDPTTNLYAASQAKNDEEAAIKGTTIVKKLLGIHYDGETLLFKNVPITIRLQWDPKMGHHVYVKTTDMKDFIKVSTPSINAIGFQYINQWDGAAVQFKLGTTIDGYIDNIAIWTGWGEMPTMNSTHEHLPTKTELVWDEVCTTTKVSQNYCSDCGLLLERYTENVTKPHVIENGYCVHCNIRENPTDDRYFAFIPQEDNTYAVKVREGVQLPDQLIIPSAYQNKAVTAIIPYGFSEVHSVKKIVIPDSITNIGAYAFYHCSSLTDVRISDNVISIGDRAFDSCSHLVRVNIPVSLTEIGSQVFQNCSALMDVTIPNGIKSIGYAAFYGCSSLKNLIIPDSVTKIESWAFAHCCDLVAIHIPDSVTYIGYSVFSDCYGLMSVKLPNDIVNIENLTFNNCYNLKNVTVPQSVKNIGYAAFSRCLNLTKIYYDGTETQWAAIYKDPTWDSGCGMHTIDYTPAQRD